jgi:tetratricopeptide (TPR) repeat protein
VILRGLLLSAWLGVAWGAPEDALDPASRQLWESAAQAEADGQWKRAAAGYRLLLNRDPGFAPAGVGLGRALFRTGDTAGAIAAWERLPTEADAVQALAELVESDDPTRAAELYRRLQTLRLGESAPYVWEARALLAVDVHAAYDVWLRYRQIDDSEPDGRVLVDLALALREAGREEEASLLLEAYVKDWPGGQQVDEARGRLDRIGVELAARRMMVGQAEPLDAAQQARVEAARVLAAQGQVPAALSALRELAIDAPNSAQVRAALGDVHLMADHVADAEANFSLAAALEPDEPAWHARLGALLAARYAGRRNREAADALELALALRPSWAELHFELGQVYRGMGDWERARGHLLAYLQAEPDGARRDEARQLAADLEREPPPPPPRVEASTAAPADVPIAAWEAYRVARVYQDRGDLATARIELAPALRLAPRWSAPLNLQAAMLLSEGEVEPAIAAWRASLALAPDQPGVRMSLGSLLEQRGERDEAQLLLREAAEGGAAEAWYVLARTALEGGRVDEAGALLDLYFSGSTGGMHHEPALALRGRIERAQRQVQLLWAGALGVVVLVVSGLLWRRYGGRSLAALVEAAPESTHDIARILAAVRHEVLKHNTSLLPEVAAALRHGDPHAAAWAAQRLYGSGADDLGIVRRFQDDLDALRRLGRVHGMRLDLERDPVLAPMARAMRQLGRLERRLRRPPQGARAREALADELEALGEALNGRAYPALGVLIRQMGRLQVDRELLLRVDERVRAEPAFQGLQLPQLVLDMVEEPVPVRVFRGDLEDIVANLLRNALTAVLEHADEARVGLHVEVEVDDVTGLEAVALRFLDSAPGALTDAIIRGRNIGRGLGLAVDLITRHGGSIQVEAWPGWAKAVTVRLERAEEGV